MTTIDKTQLSRLEETENKFTRPHMS